MKFIVAISAALATVFAVPVDLNINNRMAIFVPSKFGIVKEIQSRIVNGNLTTIEKFPWIVSLRYYGSHRCGGSIVTTKRIVTASHCTVNINPNTLSIRAGSADTDDGGEIVAVTQYVNHELFNSKILDNDISVVYIERELVMGPAISVIELPMQDAEIAEGVVATVAGWGDMCENCTSISHLQYVDLPVLTNENCNSMYIDRITTGMLCAGFAEGGRDACQGDSGGPLTVGNVLVGVVSWGDGCARPNSPGVFTRVATYRNWIDEHL
ncbi:Trypsin-2 [Pseudolycoriella hygida]|uniref:trypsin n=1 Tax=Pseudolycoriella hygida TaxID=35572 RepID=A0A9Q0ML40_9DIPT|nr:Trypsin-2 [Pseudolycoriella hygida]